jgi:two-component system LytT family response regulator
MTTPEPIRVLLVDDEAPARRNLRHALAPHGRWQVVGECASAAEVRRTLATERVDVLFLDIQMPRESGLTLARALLSDPDPPLIVFVTAWSGYAIEAFELHAVDYLLKPIDDARLARTLGRIEEVIALHAQASSAEAMREYLDEHGNQPQVPPTRYLQRLSIRSVGRIDSVLVADVLAVTSTRNYVRLILPGRTILHRVTLKHLESRLDPARFLRIHRSALVRRDQPLTLKVTGDGTYDLLLRCGVTVPVSERYVDAVRAAMLG